MTDTQTVAANVIQMSSGSGEFDKWVDERITAIHSLLQGVKEQVGDGPLEPIVGARLAAAITGAVFGYEEFYPRGDNPPAEQAMDLELLGRATLANR